jgi:hypothetical protein
LAFLIWAQELEPAAEAHVTIGPARRVLLLLLLRRPRVDRALLRFAAASPIHDFAPVPVPAERRSKVKPLNRHDVPLPGLSLDAFGFFIVGLHRADAAGRAVVRFYGAAAGFAAGLIAAKMVASRRTYAAAAACRYGFTGTGGSAWTAGKFNGVPPFFMVPLAFAHLVSS